MSMLETWFRQSIVFRFISFVINIINHSFISKVVEFIGVVLVNSKVASFLRYIASRPYKPFSSFVYRFLEYFNRKTIGFRDKMLYMLKDSILYRLLSPSKAFRIINVLLIPAVAFYALIDEIGRDILKGSTLFGYWDEAFLLLCIFYVVMYWFFFKRESLNITPLGAPMLLLISISVFIFIVNSTYPRLGFDGMRVIVQYVLWFFVLNSFITDDKKAYLIVRFMVYMAGFMGLHGIYQYIKKVPTPAYWTDAAEGATGTRVFSFVESPNILGSIFILMIPICLALVLQEKRDFLDRSIFFILLGAMGISLILTLSRGAWLGAAAALFIFCLSINPRWLLLLVAGGSAVLFIPSVMSRIKYLLSPQYFISSMTGGRLMRYEKGWEIFTQNKLMGVGLGHFGGAVAMNNKDLIPDTFYMDNYWLKTMVEMGILGIAAFGVLILALIIWSVRSIKQSGDYSSKLIASGGFAGLFGVIVHNLVENVFEVPYMVVYFWVIAAIVLYFGFRRNKKKQITN
ncbi:MAG: polymerase [Clostridiaceae bacterium]|nr:polymerase [Clostridiaceae bacterium]